MVLDSIHEETKAVVKVVFPNVPDGVKNYLQVKMECTENINNELDSVVLMHLIKTLSFSVLK